jgi:riboflavin kinase / FMN adenylyltransferase
MPARLIRSLEQVPSSARGGMVTIGNFDGVHLGHQALITYLIQKAQQAGVPATVVTFEPHAFEYFGGNQLHIPRLTRLREKYAAISDLGVDNIVILKFNHELANQSATEFVRMIWQSLQPKHIVIGDDFHFGHKRQGNFALLQKMGMELGFSVEAMPTIEVEGERVSSTRVRKALAEGNHQLTERLLGHPYAMLGRVRTGDQLGRTWGFPTANLHLHRRLTPVHGIYTVRMYGVGNKPLAGVAYVGERPTIDGTRTLLEVHLLDFNQDIYGHYVRVEFCQKLRDDAHYATVEQLKAQIAKDVAAARDYFKKGTL